MSSSSSSYICMEIYERLLHELIINKKYDSKLNEENKNKMLHDSIIMKTWIDQLELSCKELDTENIGKISEKEFPQIIKNIISVPSFLIGAIFQLFGTEELVLYQEMVEIFRSIISYKSPDGIFNQLDMVISQAKELEIDYKTCFSQYDEDGDGNIPDASFCKGIDGLGVSLSEEQAKAICKMYKVDNINTGKVDYFKFLKGFEQQLALVDTVPTLPDQPPVELNEQPKQGSSRRRRSSTTKISARTREILIAPQPEAAPRVLSDEDIEMICQCFCKAEASKLQAADIRDCFEQYDFDCSGYIAPGEFMTIFKDLEIHEHVPDFDVLFPQFIEYLGNCDYRSGGISYREFFKIVKMYRKKIQFQEDLRFVRNDQPLAALVGHLREHVAFLEFSNINFEEVFSAFDPEVTEFLSLEDFGRALVSLEVNSDVASSQDIIAHFVTLSETGEPLVDYPRFLKVVKHNPKHTEQHYYHISKRPRFLRDRFEVLQFLRKHISNVMLTRGETAEQCFHDLCHAGDGVLTVRDLFEAVTLLGSRTYVYEIRRLMSFIFLFREPHTQQDRGPFGWKCLRENFVNECYDRQFEMNFQMFLEVFCYETESVDVKQSPFGKATCVDKEECFVAAEDMLENLRNFINTTNPQDSAMISSVFAKEPGNVDSVFYLHELECREILQSLLCVEIGEMEMHHTIKRLGLFREYKGAGKQHEALWREERRSRLQEITDAIIREQRSDNRDEVWTFMESLDKRFPLNAECSRALLTLVMEKYSVHLDIAKEFVNFVDTMDTTSKIHLCGTCNIPFRKFLKRIVPGCHMVTKREAWWFNKIRGHSMTKKFAGQLNAMVKNPSCFVFRKLLHDFVSQWEDEEQFPVEIIPNICRICESRDTDTVDRVLFAKMIHLDISNRSWDLLAAAFSKESENFQSTMETLEGLDPEFSGYIQWARFQTLMRELCKGMNPGDIDRVCQRFVDPCQVLSAIDYRELCRHFEWLKDGDYNMYDHDESIDESSESANVNTVQTDLWKFMWNIGASAAPVREKDTYKSWQLKKEVYEKSIDLMNQLDQSHLTDTELWKEVMMCLVAVDMYIQVQVRSSNIPSMKKPFMDWTRKGYSFSVPFEEDPNMMVKLAYDPQNKAKAKEYIAMCEASWSESVKTFKLQVIQKFSGSGESEIDLHKQISRYAKQCGLYKLQQLKLEDDHRKEMAVQADEMGAKREKEAMHARFVERKRAMEIRLPANLEGYSDPEMEALVKRMGGRRVVHAINQRDLEQCRAIVARNGYVTKSNYLDEDGNLDSDEYERALEAKSAADGVSSAIAGTKHFDLWLERKRARDNVLNYVSFLDEPNAYDGSSEEKEVYWHDVGKALKAIDSNGLFGTFLEWSKNYTTTSRCCSAWNGFPPSTKPLDEENSWTWIHLRSVLQKILKKLDARAKVVMATFAKLVQKKAGRDSSPDKIAATAKRLQRNMPIDDVRKLLREAGLTLRLQDEKRLCEFLPGLTENNETVAEAVRIGVLLGLQDDSDAEENVSRPLEERVDMILQIAGAPESNAVDPSELEYLMSEGLEYLESMSLSKRLERERLENDRDKAKPPLPPKVGRLEITASTIHLFWSATQPETRSEVLFFKLERILDSKAAKTQTLALDPPQGSSGSAKPVFNFEVGDLQSEKMYYFQISAWNEHGGSTPTRFNCMTLPLVPPTPRVVKTAVEGAKVRCRIAWGDKTDKKVVSVAVVPPSTTLETVRRGNDTFPKSKKGSDMSGVTSYELILVSSSGDRPGETTSIHRVLYRGVSQIADVSGLEPGCSYEFAVRAANGSGEFTEASDTVTLCTPLLPCAAPDILSVRSLSVELGWKAYDHLKNTRFASGDNMLETWKSHDASKIRVEYELRVNNGVNRDLISTIKPGYSIDDLEPNSKIKISLRAVCTTMDGGTFKTPWSTEVSCTTPPSPPSEPFQVNQNRGVLVVKWYAPICGAKSYLVEMQKCDTAISGQMKENPWVQVFSGSATLASIPNLSFDYVYRGRVRAVSPTGEISEPSLPGQFAIVTKEEAGTNVMTPFTAGDNFSMPLERDDMVIGDMILFTQKNTLPCLRTIAGRVTSMKPYQKSRTKVSIQVEWSTVADKLHDASYSLVRGAILSVDVTEIFELETQLGIYRMPWDDESGRWSGEKE